MSTAVQRFVFALLLVLVAACVVAPPNTVHNPTPPAPVPAAAPVGLATLAAAQHVAGFVARAVYVDDDDRPRGARFVHERTGFVFDYLAIESAPQAFLYATTYPSSDGGAPHTQEHLLLGKGNKGRWLGNYDHVMLADWSAFTAQYRTAYHFNTAAGTGAFWGILHTQLDALLYPDYTDEDIRREVQNFGVARRPDGHLELEEKGTVYNEMVRSYESGDRLGWDAMLRLLYGKDHPLALSSGGTPEGIRGLLPEEIRRFHKEHYQLANMGMVGAFPSSVPLATVLAKVGDTLNALAPKDGAAAHFTSEADLPPPHATEPGALRVVEYPSATPDHPGSAIFAWPATRKLGLADRTLMEVFLGAFAGGEGSTLYDAVVDNKTRSLDVGATAVWQYSNEDMGQPVFVGVESVSAAPSDDAALRTLAQIRDLVQARMRAVAALPDGSPELQAFGERVKARIIEARRGLDKVLDTPPQFGVRGTGDFWIRQLADLNREEGFRKSLTLKDAYDRALAVAGSPKNPWRERIAQWGLDAAPFGVATRASPALRARLDKERSARVAAELARLVTSSGTKDEQAALRKREAEIDEATAEIGRAEASVPMPAFVSDPPMTLDDTLSYRQTTVNGVPVVESTFETMKSSTVSLLLRLDRVAPEDLLYLALLPRLMRDVGVVRDGVPIPYSEMSDRLRREVLHVGVGFDTSFASGRAELAITGSGDDAEETRRALAWMRDVMTSPDWRPENLPRIRDVVLRRATELREVMSGPEESWARSAAEAYRRQDSPLLAHTASFLARTHDAYRLSWMLEGGDLPLARYFASLEPAGKTLDRAGLSKLAALLANAEKKSGAGDAKMAPADPSLARWMVGLPHGSSLASVARAGRELGQLLSDIPDGSLASDWSYLCDALARDVGRDPKETLAALRRVLAAATRAGNARVWVVGSSRSLAAIHGDIAGLLSTLGPGAPTAPPRAVAVGTPVTDRARARGATVGDARLAALVNPSTANAALVASAPSAGFDETNDPALVDFLAANVFGGTGTHSFYKRIWGAALAYSGNFGVWPRVARMQLYSDRCADLPQLLRFVDEEVRKAPADPRFVEYAVANTFVARTADTYEQRAEAMATDLVEDVTPERVRGFRERLLAIRARPGLAAAVHERLLPVYGAVIPTLATPAAGGLPGGALWFAIGPEVQLKKYESELRAVQGQKAGVLRLYPRDFWQPPAR
jgi:hypothetical protein